ncbi:hypothetical protein QBC39DRAFT_2292 [Podospora conica]|nr:hypothetical protein QBC39DRAFT_2292 [Schizothecium conicum]
MKASALFVALQCAALAASAPVLLSSGVDTKTDTPSRPQWQSKFPKMAVETVFHDRPASHASPRPPSTEYLTSFTHRRPKSNRERAVDGRPPSRAQRLDMEGVITITRVDAVVSVPVPVPSSRLDTSCHLARLARERDDVTVVLLSMVFFLVVLAVEGWGLVCQSVRRAAYGHGEIRLEDGEGGKCACGGALSVRSDPEEAEEDEAVPESEKVNPEALG